MSLKDLTLDDIETLETTLNAAVLKGKELIKFYKNLEAQSIGDTLEHVGDDVSDLAEQLLPALDRTKLKDWKIRAIPIEAVNVVLSDFEYGVQELYTVATESIVVREIYKVFGVFMWILSNKKLLYQISEAVQNRIIKFAAENAQYLNPMLYVFMLFSESANVGYVELIKEKFNLERKFIEALAAVLGLIATVEVVEGMVTAFGALKSKKQWSSLNQLLKVSVDRLEKKSFPQSKSRWNRRRLQRVRARKK